MEGRRVGQVSDGGTSMSGPLRRGNFLVSAATSRIFFGDSVDVTLIPAKRELTPEEARLEAALDDDSANAVLGDLGELFERDLKTMSQKDAERQLRKNIKSVERSLPNHLWRRHSRSFYAGLKIGLFIQAVWHFFLSSAF